MKPEHRSAHRAMIGDSLFSAENHLRAAAELGNDFPEHRAFHEGESRSAMKRAGAMCRMVADSLKASHEDADAAQTVGQVRTAPIGTVEELAKEWAACQRAALPYSDITFADAAVKIGVKSPQDLLVTHRTNEQIIKLFHSGKAQERKAAVDAEQKLCGELIETLRRSTAGLEPGLECEMLGLDPADPKRETRQGQPWTSEMLRRMVVQLEVERPVVTRPAEVRSAETQTQGAMPIVPATQPARPAGNPDPKVDPAVAAYLAEHSRRSGANEETMRKAAQRLS